MLRLWRLLQWKTRRSRAEDEVAYYRSAVLFYSQKLREAKAKVGVVERQRIDVDYPPPRGVRGMA